MKNKKHILIVDDSNQNIETLFSLLKNDYILTPAKNGESAIKKAHRIHPDLILLDILMPGMSGYEVCERLKGNDETKDIPIIFVTAISEAMDEAKAFNVGAIDYITKPFVPVVVKARVWTHLTLKDYRDNLEALVDMKTRELQLAKIEAEKANRAKSEFLMNMSHELRTPLNGVLASAALITGNESKKEILELKETIESSSYELLKTVKQILEYTRSKDGDIVLQEKPFTLKDTLKNIKTKFMHKGLQIEAIPRIRIEGDPVPDGLIGDSDQLLFILNTVMENAAKFNKQKPEVVLTLKALENTSEHVFIQFSVQDNGIGIPEEFTGEIFKPFFQADASTTRKHDGVGMGLSVCRQLIKRMDGQIWVESDLDKGSTFHFTARFAHRKSAEYLDMPAVEELMQRNFTD